MSITATTTYSGRYGEIAPGDTVLYSALKPNLYGEIDGQVTAVSDGDQIVFGEAKIDGRNITVNGKPYPRHMVRGIVWAVIRSLSKNEEPGNVPIANQTDP